MPNAPKTAKPVLSQAEIDAARAARPVLTVTGVLKEGVLKTSERVEGGLFFSSIVEGQVPGNNSKKPDFRAMAYEGPVVQAMSDIDLSQPVPVVMTGNWLRNVFKILSVAPQHAVAA